MIQAIQPAPFNSQIQPFSGQVQPFSSQIQIQPFFTQFQPVSSQTIHPQQQFYTQIQSQTANSQIIQSQQPFFSQIQPVSAQLQNPIAATVESQSAQTNTIAPNQQGNNQQPKPQTRYKNYTLSFKLNVLDYVSKNNNNITHASRHFNIDRKVIRNWRKNKSKIVSQSHKTESFRIKKSPHPRYKEMEEVLYDWVVEQRDLGLCVSQRSIKRKALEIVSQTNSTFLASSGWLHRFLKRNKLVLRRITTSGRELSKDAPKIINDFLDHCTKFQVEGFDRRCLINMDETSIYLDSPSNKILTNFQFKLLLIFFLLNYLRQLYLFSIR